MRKITAIAGSAVFLVIAPGVVAGLVPWWITGWRTSAAYPAAVRITGAVLVAAGAAALIYAFALFALQGLGTPAPPVPTERLVQGLYCCVRNPMYLAVVAVIVGQSLLLSRPVLLVYAAAIAALFVAFVYGKGFGSDRAARTDVRAMRSGRSGTACRSPGSRPTSA